MDDLGGLLLFFIFLICGIFAIIEKICQIIDKKNDEKIKKKNQENEEKELDQIRKYYDEREQRREKRGIEIEEMRLRKNTALKLAKETNRSMSELVADGSIAAKEYEVWQLLWGDCINEKIDEPNIDKIDEPHIVYYVKVDNGSLGCLYKIGITKHDVHTRFSSSERDVMTVIKEWKFDSRMEARLYEDSVLKSFSDHKYQGPNVLDSGNTELFTRDVMGLDVAA